MKKSKIAVGCQSWTYDDWITKPGDQTCFYPRGTRSGEMLALYAKIFETIEVDSTLYGIPTSSTIQNWYAQTPGHFTFSLKMPNEIVSFLDETSLPSLGEFCGRALELKEKLAVVLIHFRRQFAASKENAASLREFLALLPRTIRFAAEFGDRAWLVDWTLEELEKNRVALCLVEDGVNLRAPVFDMMKKSTVDFSYIRFKGERDLPKSDKIYRPRDANLQIWKEEIEKIKGKEIFVYFSNFYEGHSPASANKLKRLLGQKTIDPSEIEKQGSLF
jgi:uncharacterized protein YecE (DUF72 family)